MIFITYRESRVKNVWDVVPFEKEDYLKFMETKAKEVYNIVVNPHWLNIMDRELYHLHLTDVEYLLKEKMWKKTLGKWPIDRYIQQVLGGKKIEYED